MGLLCLLQLYLLLMQLLLDLLLSLLPDLVLLHKHPTSLLDLVVSTKRIRPCKGFLTVNTDIGLRSSMDSNMSLQIVFARKDTAAQVTTIWLGCVVRLHMCIEIEWTREGFSA